MGLRGLNLSHATGLFWALAASALCIALFGDAGREMLAFDRSAIAGHELWRFLTGHFAHLGWSHLLLNVVGLLMVAVLFGDGLPVRDWWLAGVVSLLAVSFGLWFLNPEVTNYVGLSGLLHGLFVAGIEGSLRKRPVESTVLGLLVIVKLVYEQVAGPLPGSEASSGGAVIVDAHLYGAVGGFLFGIYLVSRRRVAGGGG